MDPNDATEPADRNRDSSVPAVGTFPPPMVASLPQHEVIAVEGADAADFLQRQCMNDLRELAVIGDWQWNGLLSAKGRVLALFAVLRVGEQAFWLLLPDGDADHWMAALTRLVFRSKLRLVARPEVQAIGIIGDEPAAEVVPALPSPSRAACDEHGWWLDHGSPGRPRRMFVGTVLPAGLRATATPDATAAWALENLRHGLPRVTVAHRDTHTPQMLALDRLAAFSVRKGCYPGQEIVARTHFLGQAKRRLARLCASGPFADDESVACGEQRVQVFAHAAFDGAFEAVAVLPVEPADGACRREDGTAIQREAFIDGLARRPG